jgi:hypothetical protein
MYKFKQHGGGKCSLCNSPNTNQSTCPLNPSAKSPDYEKHFLAKHAQAPEALAAAKASRKQQKEEDSARSKASGPLKKPSAKAKRYGDEALAYNEYLKLTLVDKRDYGRTPPGREFYYQKPELPHDLNANLVGLFSEINQDNIVELKPEITRAIRYGSYPIESLTSMIIRTDKTRELRRVDVVINIEKTLTADRQWLSADKYMGFLDYNYDDHYPYGLCDLVFKLKDQAAIDDGGVKRVIMSNIADYFKTTMSLHNGIYYLTPETNCTRLGNFMGMCLISDVVVDLPMPLELFEYIISCTYILHKDMAFTDAFDPPLYKLIYLMHMKNPGYAKRLLNLLNMDNEDIQEYVPLHPQSIQKSEDETVNRTGPLLNFKQSDNFTFLERYKYRWYYDVLMRNLYGKLPTDNLFMSPGFPETRSHPFVKVYDSIISWFDDGILSTYLIRGFNQGISLNINIFVHHFNNSSSIKLDTMLEYVDRAVCNIDHKFKAYLRQYVTETDPVMWKTLLKFISGSVDITVTITINNGLQGRLPAAHTCFSSIDIDSTIASYDEFKTKLNTSLSNVEGAFGFA